MTDNPCRFRKSERVKVMLDQLSRSQRVLLVAVVSAVTSACGPAADPGYRPVSGTISLDGEPLAEAIVSFLPDGEGSSGTGRTDDSGRYTLFYASQRPGAKVGLNRVMISKESSVSRADSEFAAPDEEEGELLPSRYNIKTELTATVEEGDNVFDFQLTTD
jgi:hypothetical protein